VHDGLGMFTFGKTVQSAPAARKKKGLIPDLVSFAREQLDFWPDLRQEELLRSRVSRGMVNCTRQWGKSTVAAVMAVHRAYFFPKSLVVVACPSEKQSAELVWKAGDFLGKLGVKKRGDGSNRISLKFPNGSRIIGLPGNETTSRGFSAVSLMIIDEASRVDDAVYKALRPMLAVGSGDLWLLSTPFGKRGFFYENWQGGQEARGQTPGSSAGDDWVRTSVRATDCPRISEKFLEEERRQMGDMWFRQEYMCEFVEDGSRLFDTQLVMEAMDDLEPMHF
jgi:hypothetical protein